MMHTNIVHAISIKQFLFLFYLFISTDAMTTEHDNQSENTCKKTTATQQVVDNKVQ